MNSLASGEGWTRWASKEARRARDGGTVMEEGEEGKVTRGCRGAAGGCASLSIEAETGCGGEGTAGSEVLGGAEVWAITGLRGWKADSSQPSSDRSVSSSSQRPR